MAVTPVQLTNPYTTVLKPISKRTHMVHTAIQFSHHYSNITHTINTPLYQTHLNTKSTSITSTLLHQTHLYTKLISTPSALLQQTHFSPPLGLYNYISIYLSFPPPLPSLSLPACLPVPLSLFQSPVLQSEPNNQTILQTLIQFVSFSTEPSSFLLLSFTSYFLLFVPAPCLSIIKSSYSSIGMVC